MRKFDLGRNILDDTAIVAAIEKYVDESLYDYAVMIDGAWGCGKTYFVLKTLKAGLMEHEKKKAESIKGYKKRNIIYISL
ncbi:MAG: P-loop NTPase fold protein [Bacteroides fragilis]|nr:P-loop NTPase fold protein [Bacteroides fragilis]